MKIAKNKQIFASVAVLMLAFALMLVCALHFDTAAADAAAQTYAAQFHEMTGKYETNDRYSSVTYYTADEALAANQTTSFDLNGGAISRYMAGTAYAAAVCWTAPSAGTITTASNVAYKWNIGNIDAGTRVFVLKGFLPEEGQTSVTGLELLHEQQYDDATEKDVAINIYSYVAGQEMLAGESVMFVYLNTKASGTSSAVTNFGARIAFQADGQDSSEAYSFVTMTNNDKEESGLFSVDTWKSKNPTYSFWAVSGITQELMHDTVSRDALSEVDFGTGKGIAEKEALNADYGNDPSQMYGNWCYDAVDGDPLKGNGDHTVYSTNGRSAVVPFPYNWPVLAWRASEAGTVSVESLKLDNTYNHAGSGNGDGIRFAVLVKSAEGKYYNLYGETLWHALAAYQTSTYTDIPAVQLAAGEELLFLFNCGENNNETHDGTYVDLDLRFKTENSYTAIAMDQTSGKINEQGGRGFYFRFATLEDVYTVKFLDENGGQLLSDQEVLNGNEAELPVPSAVSGKTFIGWKNAEKDLYPAGAKLTVSEDISFTAVYLSLSTESASFKIGANANSSGVAFSSTLDLGNAESYIEEFGTIAMPQDLLAGKELTFENFAAGTQSQKIVSTIYTESDGSISWSGGIGGILEQNYTRAFEGRGYVLVKYADGTSAYFYAETAASGNVAALAKVYKETGDSGYAQLSAARKAIVDGYAAAAEADN